MAQKNSAALVAAALLAAIWACAPRDDSRLDDSLAIDSAGGTLAADTNWMEPALMSDAAILGALKEINNAEIAAAELALDRTRNSELTTFARKLVSDHKRLMAWGDSLADALDINVADPPDPLENHHKMTMDSLKRADAATSKSPDALKRPLPADTASRTMNNTGFDSSFIDAMFSGHGKVLEFVDSALKRSMNAQLTASLQKDVRPAIAAHLAEAERLHNKFGSKASPMRDSTAAGLSPSSRRSGPPGKGSARID